MSADGSRCPDTKEDDAKHCLHELPGSSVYAPGLICCWCGDIFVMPEADAEHGDFKPKAEGKS